MHSRQRDRGIIRSGTESCRRHVSDRGWRNINLNKKGELLECFARAQDLLLETSRGNFSLIFNVTIKERLLRIFLLNYSERQFHRQKYFQFPLIKGDGDSFVSL